MIARLFLALAVLAAAVAPARADEFKPAYLEIRQTAPETYDVSWRVPAIEEGVALAVLPRFPEGTEVLAPPRGRFAAGASVEHWSVRAPGGLEGRTIDFPGLARHRIDVLVRVERADGTAQLGRVLPVDPAFTVTASPGPLEVVSTYTRIGIEHILLGVDHLLFVLALVMIVRDRRTLVVTITSFTLAHSITLALATLDVLRIPGPPVEAAIALSIVFVAAEILARERGSGGVASRKPWLVAFSFGLLHGLGFAGALAEVGLPPNAIPLALVFFNVGVEIGQLAFVFAVLLAVRGAITLGGRVPAYARGAVAYAIGGIASYWLFDRVAGFVA